MRYILALHEGAAVSMAEGYAQATGVPAVVNLHAASGSGNGMGAVTNAVYSRTPLLLTAGQQVRSAIGTESMLSNVSATELMRPLVTHAAEPACSSDVPRAVAHALFEAQLQRRPTYLSVPYDDWDQPTDSNTEHAVTRKVVVTQRPSADLLTSLAGELNASRNPALVVGSHVDTVGAFDEMVALAEKLQAPTWIAPSSYRLPFPNQHPLFQGVLPAGIAPVSAALDGHDLVLVLGAPVFRYHQHLPGRLLPEGTRLVQVTDEPGAAARAPAGDAIVTDIRVAISELVGLVEDRGRPTTVAWKQPPPAHGSHVPGMLHPDEVFATLRETLSTETTYVVEPTSTSRSFWEQMDLRRPDSFYWPASGGLGYGLAASVGIQLGQPSRRTVALIGDGSANYSITALWTAAQHNVPVTFIILRNGTYGALRGFAQLLDTTDVPGLDIPGIDFCALASGYGVEARHVTSTSELAAAVRNAPQDGPVLIQVDTLFPDATS